MKTSDLRNCAGIGRDQLEERMRECADLLDVLIPLGKQPGERCGHPGCYCSRPFPEDIAIAHFESLPGNFLPYTPPKLTQLDPPRLTPEQVAWANDLLARTCVLCGATEQAHDDATCSFGFTPRMP